MYLIFVNKGLRKNKEKLTALHILEALYSHVMVKMLEQHLEVFCHHPPAKIDYEITVTPLGFNMFREKGGVTREQLRMDLENVVFNS